MGLVQAELERRGIVTVSLTMMREISEKVRPPRTLVVPYPLGFPLGEPNAPETQLEVLHRLLALASRTDVPVVEQLGT